MSLNRTPMPPRTKPLARTAGLSRTAPLRRTGGWPRFPRRRRPPAPQAPDTSSALALVLAGEATVAQAARIHGCDPEGLELLARVTVRAAVLQRDDHRCQNCLCRAVDVQHRIRRGMGGTADPVIAFGLCNLVALCRECHDLADRQRDAGMHKRGFRLDTCQDPAVVPIVIPSPTGPQRVWLLADGGRSYQAPETGEAA